MIVLGMLMFFISGGIVGYAIGEMFTLHRVEQTLEELIRNLKGQEEVK